jgi:hypothetical protein
MWDEWIYTPGLPPAELNFTTEALDAPIMLAEDYIALSGADSPDNFGDYTNYLYSQKLAFVQTIGNSEGVNADLLSNIDEDLNLTLGETNPFVKNEWYIIGIRNGYEPVYPQAYKWMGDQGRHAFVTPTFTALVEDAGDCETATAWYADYKDTYNSYVQNRVDGVMKACSDEESTAPEPSTPTEEPAPGTEPPTSGAATKWMSTGTLAAALLAVAFHI